MDVGKSTSAHEEYVIGHDKLTQWARWLRATQSPMPKMYPDMQPMFRDVEQRYREETHVIESYDPDEAELCQAVIKLVMANKERLHIVLHLSYPMNLSKIQAANEIGRMNRNWRCNRHLYGGWLDQAVAVIDSAYTTMDFFKR